jgi:hypothetical protein
LNSSHVAAAVESFINFKVDQLAIRKTYKSELRESVKEYLTGHADGTFLWVALVCKELDKVRAWQTQKTMEKFPEGLESLYQRMMEQIRNDEENDEAEFCLKILRTVTLALRPLQLNEMGSIAGLEDLCSDVQALQDLVNSCGSFLTLRGEVVYFVHQSAKDYFIAGKGSEIFSPNQTKEHGEIAYRLLQQMENALRRDICNRQKPGALLNKLESGVDQKHFTYIRYACCYWAQHLQRSETHLHDNDHVHKFLQKHFLHWLEALSLMGKISDGAVMVSALESMLTVSN